MVLVASFGSGVLVADGRPSGYPDQESGDTRAKSSSIPAPLMLGIIIYVLFMIGNAAFGQMLPS
jgi:hypothetical protein